MPKTSTRSLSHPDKRLSLQQAAARESVTVRTVRRWIANGDLRAYRVGSRLIRIEPADLDRMSRRVPAATRRQSA